MNVNYCKHTNFIVFCIITLFSFCFWKPDSNFFWGDEWVFLVDFRDLNSYAFFLKHGQHIKPLFELVYFLELNIFGVNNLLYSYFNIIVFSISVYYFYRVLNLLFEEIYYSLIFALFYCIHPLNYYQIAWTFQICVILQILFQILLVYNLLLYFKTRNAAYFVYSIIALFAQNYSFGNGVFVPALVVVGLFLFDKTKNRARFTTIILSIQFLFIVFQAMNTSPSGLLATTILEIIYAFFFFIAANITATVFVMFKINGFFLGWIILAVFSLMIFRLLFYRRSYGPYIFFFVFWILVVSFSIPVARFDSIISGHFRHYYSALSLPAILICFAFIGYDFYIRISPKYYRFFIISLSLAFCLIFLLDQRLINIFSTRHFRNKLAMYNAIKNNQPFISPIDLNEGETEGYSNQEKKDAYLYWRDRTPFMLTSEKILD